MCVLLGSSLDTNKQGREWGVCVEKSHNIVWVGFEPMTYQSLILGFLRYRISLILKLFTVDDKSLELSFLRLMIKA